eukprot:6610834-Alexandrium_andersonii.AAC.1
MSASLVGSEMCIRDRVLGAHATRKHPCRKLSAARARARLQLSAARVGAVSYTHLTLPTICSV